MTRKTLLAFSVLFLLGCDGKSITKPVTVPPGTTIEIYATSPAAGPSTISAIDPVTKTTINLVTPPIITTSDIATVAKSYQDLETTGNASPPTSIPSLEIVLNANGAAKMLAATTNPTSPVQAVVVNGTTIAAPKIITPINKSFRVIGDHRSPLFLNGIRAATGQPNG